jgi:uncharacterized protein GlcG (DUF336 family)
MHLARSPAIIPLRSPPHTLTYPSNTHEDKEAVWPGGPAFGIWNTNNNRFTTIAGGVPILSDGVVIGAIGCSTGLPAQDEDVALRGVEAVSKELKVKAKL